MSGVPGIPNSTLQNLSAVLDILNPNSQTASPAGTIASGTPAKLYLEPSGAAQKGDGWRTIPKGLNARPYSPTFLPRAISMTLNTICRTIPPFPGTFCALATIAVIHNLARLRSLSSSIGSFLDTATTPRTSAPSRIMRATGVPCSYMSTPAGGSPRGRTGQFSLLFITCTAIKSVSTWAPRMQFQLPLSCPRVPRTTTDQPIQPRNSMGHITATRSSCTVQWRPHSHPISRIIAFTHRTIFSNSPPKAPS
jgi:hypothetical protein